MDPQAPREFKGPVLTPCNSKRILEAFIMLSGNSRDFDDSLETYIGSKGLLTALRDFKRILWTFIMLQGNSRDL